MENEPAGDRKQNDVQEVEMEELKMIDVQRTSLMEIKPARDQQRRREPRTSLLEIVTWCLIGAGIGAWAMLLLCLA